MNPLRFIRKNIKAIAGYFLFCLAAFILFFYILFPREEIKARIIYEIEKGTSTEIRTVADRWIFPIGLKFTGMEFKKKGAIDNLPLLRIDRLSLDMPLKSIISLSPLSNLSADLYGGTLKGTLTMRINNRILQVNWANIDVSRIERLKAVPVIIAGKVSGDMVLRLVEKKPEGQIRLLMKDGNLGKLQVMGFALPDIPVDELHGVIDIKENTISLNDLRFKNNDLKGSIKGDIRLAPAAGQEILDISIRFAVGEKMRSQYQGILSLISHTKDRDGYYTLHIKGDFKKPAVGM